MSSQFSAPKSRWNQKDLARLDIATRNASCLPKSVRKLIFTQWRW